MAIILKAKTMKEAKKDAHCAAIIKAVDGGFIAFYTIEEYAIWQRKQDEKRRELNAENNGYP